MLLHSTHTLRSMLGAAFAAALLAGGAALAGCSDTSSPPQSAATAPSTGPDAVAMATLSAATALNGVTVQCGEQNLAALRNVWERFPTDPFVRQQLRSTLETCLQWDGLAEVLEALPEDERTDADRIELAGVYLRNLGRFADAEETIMPLVERYPDDMNIVSLAAASLYYQERIVEAVPMIDRIWDQMVAVKNTDTMTMRAVAFIDAGNPERAARILEQVIEFNPDHSFAWTTLARARQALGDEVGAQEARERNEALRSEESERTRQGQRFGDLSLALQAAWDAAEFEEVERLALRMLEVAPENMEPEVYRVLGRAYNELARPAEAREAFEKADELERALPVGGAP